MTSPAPLFSALAAIPFAGLLLSIAVFPLVAPKFWHGHFGKIAAAWSLALLVPFGLSAGLPETGHLLAHTFLQEYIPFIVLLAALFTTAGGIYIRGDLQGSPTLNAGLMLIGALLASVMGTTGASMLLVRPLIRANDKRRYKAHVLVFFIFIVSNAGGSLTPLGDPPLFLGFLQGVDFFWTASQIFKPMLFLIGALLALFWWADRHFYLKEGVAGRERQDPTSDSPKLGIEGAINLLPLSAVVGLVLMSGLWKPAVSLHLLGVDLALPSLLRDGLLLVVIAASLVITPRGLREKNQFSWAPMQEVAKLFAGIFLTMAPVLAMLKAGEQGPFAALIHAVTGADGQPLPGAYFWLSGLLSAFLDNAPTYLVFFNLAGGDPQVLMTSLAGTLAAISAGSVFMGAISYIGNAPNFMVKAIAEERGVKMPGFFGYLAWSGTILLPLFVAMTFIWFR